MNSKEYVDRLLTGKKIPNEEKFTVEQVIEGLMIVARNMGVEVE